MSIQDARQKCQDKNSRLFEPKNGADYHAVLAVAKKVVENWSGNVFFWLGLHDKTNEGIFTHFSTDNFTLPGEFFSDTALSTPLTIDATIQKLSFQTLCGAKIFSIVFWVLKA